MELVDVPTIGSKFTWANKSGNVRRKIDRFFLFENKVKSNDVDWEPKPFRVNNGWYQHKEFQKFVEEVQS
ncbi:unnamed protein product [Lathyrus sativus]|nr:unnamed protein product [Lathyrus sativus]